MVAQRIFTSTRFFTSMPRSTRRRHHMHQHLQPLSSSPVAPVDLQAFPPVQSVPPPLVPLVDQSAPPPTPCPGIVPLVADCLTQPDHHAHHDILCSRRSRPPSWSPLYRCPIRLAPAFASCSLDLALSSPSSRTTIVAALASSEPPGGASSQ